MENQEVKTMYEEVPAITDLNKVDGFDPRKYLREMSNDFGEKGMYLDVQWRKLWFRLRHPNGRIKKTIVKMTEETVIIEAKVYLDRNDPDDSYISSAMAQRWRQPDDKIKNQYVESAETAATGRALLDGGFGLQFCDVGGEKDPAVVDAPIPVNDTKSEIQKSQTTQKPESTPVNNENSGKPETAENDKQQETVPPKEENTASAREEKRYDISTPVEEICKMMTIDEAKEYVVGVGFQKGKTLGQIAIAKPESLVWYINNYGGPDNILRAGAILLINAATEKQKAS